MAWTLRYSDDFNRSNENPIGGNWAKATEAPYACQLASNALTCSVGGAHNISLYTGGTLESNQFVRARVVGIQYRGMYARITNGASMTGYVFWYGWNLLDIYRIDGMSSWTNIGGTINLNHYQNGILVKYAGSITGTTFKSYDADTGHTLTDGLTPSEWHALSEKSDSTYSSGYAGLGMYERTTEYWEDFQAGDEPSVGHPAMRRCGGVPFMTIGRRKW